MSLKPVPERNRSKLADGEAAVPPGNARLTKGLGGTRASPSDERLNGLRTRTGLKLPADREARVGDRVVIPNLAVADTFASRAIGLLGQRSLPEGTGLWIRRAASIHTFGMAFTLDVIFLDRTCRVVSVKPNLEPFRVAFGGLGADSVIEVQAGWLDLTTFTTGTAVEIKIARETPSQEIDARK